jgi:DNA-binding CsgD family transcriptional regulator
MRAPSFYLLLLGYGGLAAAVMASLWLITLAPVRLGWGRELVGAAIAIVAMSVGLQLARRRQDTSKPAAAPRDSPESADASESPPAETPVMSPPVAAAPPLSHPGEGAPSAAELSLREREVLQHLADGLSNKEIARALSVSENTVKTHLANVYAKLGVGRRIEALKAARERGLA